MLDINNLKMEDVLSTGNGILELLEQSILTIENVKQIEHFENLNTYHLSGNLFSITIDIFLLYIGLHIFELANLNPDYVQVDERF